MRVQDIIADFLQRADLTKMSPDDAALALLDHLAREQVYIGIPGVDFDEDEVGH